MGHSDSTLGKNSRLYLLGSILVLWCLAICGRLIYLQIFCYGTFVKQAEHQQQRAIPLTAKRGIIYDRSGRELAMSVMVDSAFAVPSEVKDLPTVVSLTSRITGEDANVVLADCRAHKTFCWVARKADDETIGRIKSLNLQGIHFQKEPKRFYPARELGAQFLGSVGMEDSGQSGIEHEFDDELRGRAGKMFISVDARRQWFSDIETQPEPGENLVLTIDKNIQYIAEKELNQAMHDTQAVAGTVIVENPHTGEILALANRPTFNPNSRRQITPSALTNRAVSYIYEPGSAFKVVTISAALEEKLTNPNELVDCQMGSIVYNGMRIRDAHPHGVLPVSGVLAKSSNVGTIKIALRLGEDRYYRYIRAFGFGQQTGIELPGETRGITKPPSRWSKVSIAAISIGQEIGVSPIQLAGLISTIANDGVRVAPRIVMGTVPPQGSLQNVAFHPVEGQRVISPYTAAEMRSMMQKVVLEGTARRAMLEGYTAGGKTGTGQKIDPATGAYSKTKYNATFAGFAPLNNPQVVVAVILDSPVGPHQGGEVSAPVFHRVAQQVLEYLHVPHDLPLTPKHQLMMANINDKDLVDETPDHPGEPLETAESGADASPGQKPAAAHIAPASRPASGTVVQAAIRQPIPAPVESKPQAVSETPDPATPTLVPAGGTVVLDVEQGGIEVPNFIGKTVRSSVEAAQDAGLELEAAGSGLARQQTPAAGSHVPAGTRVLVQFGR
ncbi:MAG TPA: penicillin-binding transpeptidase domain-containing protein [Candidatus Sulfotelmatobacter sp.]|nr:penicillin-binding transpeptidase domain-containing protein [Candidatus Sulfotelmatobacter sp.]